MSIEIDLGSVSGPPGEPGETGPTGQPGEAATIQIGTVQSGQEANVTNSGDNHNAVFNFVLPVGPPGQDGQNGTNGADGQDGAPGSAATIEIGNVTSGSTAQVSNSGTPNAAILNFVLPVGPPGQDGQDGADGEQGPPGTSATIQIGSVTSGDVASVTNVGTSSAAKFNFVLPKGDKGDKGDTGEKGETGKTGPQGVPGVAGKDGKTPSFQIKSDGHLYAVWED